MADRVLLGQKGKNLTAFVDILDYEPSPAYAPAGVQILPRGWFATVTVRDDDVTKYIGNEGDGRGLVFFPPMPLEETSRWTKGQPQQTRVTSGARLITGFVPNSGNVQFQIFPGLDSPTRGEEYLSSSIQDAITYWSENSLQLETAYGDDFGLWVSKPSTDVTGLYAQGANLSFTSTEGFGTLRVLQTGTFQIQCKKTFMGKKGALEIGSDEQMRANADYTKRYPFELDVINDFNEYYSTLPKNANVALYGFGQGEVPITGNAFNHAYVQNVYCDYGTQTIEFNPPLPKHIKTPHISLHFAVGNSSGHFHPWYANVVCNNSDHEWQYANSQQCVHMDTAWFRGKWTFRERTFAPFGTNVNEQFPTEIDTSPGEYYSFASSSARATGPVGDAQVPGHYIVDDGAGVVEPGVVSPRIRDFQSELGPNYSATNYPRIQNEMIAFHTNISYNVGDTDLNSPTSLWGGMMKSFAGLQGLTYFANSTHLKIDGFMTPTHTPTPFETEIVKERVTNDGDVVTTDFDTYENFRKNVGWYSAGAHSGQSYETYRENTPFDRGFGLPYKEKLPRKFRTKYWDGTETEYEWWPIGHANGHFTIAKALESGAATINIKQENGIDDINRNIVKGLLQQEATAMYDSGKISSADVQYGSVSDIAYRAPIQFPGELGVVYPPDYDELYGSSGTRFGVTSWHFPIHVGYSLEGATFSMTEPTYSPWIAAAYGDYSIVKEMGLDPGHDGTPWITVVNKGTRFSNQLPDTEAKGYPPNSQYEPGDAFLKTRTFQGQPTSLDSFWNSFSNNRSQWVSSNTPYGEFYYADGGYAIDASPYFNYGGGITFYAAEKTSVVDASGNRLIKMIPSDWNVQRQSFQKHNWHGGNPKAGVGTEGRRFGFGGAGSAEALGGEGEGVFDTYYGKYIIYDIEGGDSDA